MRPKLVTPARRLQEDVTIVERTFLDRLLHKKGTAITFAGRTRYSDAVIQMGRDVGIGHRMSPLLFGTELYVGLVPVTCLGDMTYVCHVANIETVLIGE